MKKTRFATSILVALCLAAVALAQGTSASTGRFAKGGVTFQYPSAWTLTDKSTEDNHHLVLELSGTAAQIMVLVERTASTKPGERAAVIRARNTAFADLMTKELEKVGATVQRSEVSTEAGGVQADGLRLRANPGGAPGSVEVYSLVLGGRLVMLTLLRPDADAQAAAPAWNTIRSSLRVETSAGQSTSSPSINASLPTKAPSERFAGVDYGKVSGSSYANDFFGFRLTIPYGWRVEGEEVKDLLKSKGREQIQTGNPQQGERLAASLSNTINLLTVFKYAVGSSVEFNASLICGAEWLQNPSISANQYMAASKKVLESSNKQYYFKPISTETVGGESFTVMEVEMTTAIKQKYYVAIKRDYALFFIATYVTDEDEAVLRQALRSVRFS
jgi:hypothetical protein